MSQRYVPIQRGRKTESESHSYRREWMRWSKRNGEHHTQAGASWIRSRSLRPQTSSTTRRRSCASVSLACCSVTSCSPSESAPSLRGAWNRTMLGRTRPPLWGRPRRPRGASSRDKSLIKVANPSGHLPQKPTWGEFWERCCCVRAAAAAAPDAQSLAAVCEHDQDLLLVQK